MQTDLLPSYLNGWFRVAFSHELKTGQTKALKYFGKDLVAFRGTDGRALVLDAFCPHLGAHLGHGGQVIENSIRCPFHGWRFDGRGQCIEVPFAKKTPKACIPGWSVHEVNGVIFVHHHDQGAPPTYLIPSLPEFAPHVSKPVYNQRIVHTNIQDLPENAVDLTHFLVVHHGNRFTGFRKPGTLTKFEAHGPILEIGASSEMQQLGRTQKAHLDITMYGPGFNVVHIDSSAQMMMVNMLTPIDDERVDFSFMIRAIRPRVPVVSRLLEHYVSARTGREVDQDAVIWKHKRYEPKPILSSADGPVHKLRKWMTQFHPNQPPPASKTVKLSA